MEQFNVARSSHKSSIKFFVNAAISAVEYERESTVTIPNIQCEQNQII